MNAPTDAGSAYLAPEARARVEIDAMLAAAGWAVQDAGREPVRLARRRRPRVRPDAAARPRRLPALRRPPGRRGDRGEEGGRDAHRRRVADGEVRRRHSRRDADGARGRAAVRLRVDRRRDAFTNTLDPEPTSRDVFSFHRPETLAGWLERGRRADPTAPHAPPPAASSCRRSTTERPLAGAGARRSATSSASLADEPPARADPDGDRLGQDVHRGEHLRTG